jgi:hypothetical protein
MVVEKTGRSLLLLITGAVVLAVFVHLKNCRALTETRYLPEYSASGDLIMTVKESDHFADAVRSRVLELQSLQAKGSRGLGPAKIRIGSSHGESAPKQDASTQFYLLADK